MNRTLTYILRPEDNAVTHYEVLKREKGHSLVSFHLETGRTPSDSYSYETYRISPDRRLSV